jgi:hypothetical protein
MGQALLEDPVTGKVTDAVEMYRAQFEAIETQARDILGGLTDEQLAWQPEPEGWSIADCLDHLIVAGRQSLSYVAEAVDVARAGGMWSTGPFRYGMVERWVVWLMEPPARMKFAAPRAYRPTCGRPGAIVVDEFLLLQQELRQSVEQARGLDLAKVKVRNPVTRWFKFSLGQEFAIAAAHERRHLWQVRAIKMRRAFPKNR